MSLCVRGVIYLVQAGKDGSDQLCIDEQANLDLRCLHIDIERDMNCQVILLFLTLCMLGNFSCFGMILFCLI